MLFKNPLRLRSFTPRLRHCAGPVAFALCLSLIGAGEAANNSIQGAKKDGGGGFEIEAPQAILIDATSGSVLFEKNADQLSAPSSMMKLMTAEFVFNEIGAGRIKLADEYRVSENAWRKGGAPSGGSTMFAALNSRVPVADLLRGAIIHSGNDACIILAEGIAGSEAAFAEKLTERARAIGLTQATFGNASGLPDPKNLMTVRELATLARHLIRTYPEFYKIFGEREFTWNKIRQQNRNPLLATLPGADGLKTGFTKEGGYGMVASAEQNGTRLIAAINGGSDPDDRADDAKRLLEWGFRNFETRRLFTVSQPIGQVRVFGGATSHVDVVSPEAVAVMNQRGSNERLVARLVYTGPVAAPVASGQYVGVLKVWRGNAVILETPVFAREGVPVGPLTRRAIDGARELVVGIVRRFLTKDPAS